MKTDRYVYPAMIGREPGDERVGVIFPDLPGCVTSGETAEEALEAAKRALSLHLWGMEDDGDEVPAPSLVETLRAEAPWQAVALVEAWMPPVRDRMANKAVNKTLTLPRWLDEAGKRAGLNFSQVLQEGVMDRLGISHERISA